MMDDIIKSEEITSICKYIHEHWKEKSNVKDAMTEEDIAAYYSGMYGYGMYAVRHRLFLLEALGLLKKAKSFSGRAVYYLTPKGVARAEKGEKERGDEK